ncbi:MAG: hypothetical protein ACRDTF_10505 [Pseudonocardiaceae bacterium]
MAASYAGALPANFSIVEVLDDDPAATAYLISDTEARDAVLTVAKAAMSDEDRAAHRRWAEALTTAAATPHVADLIASGLTPDGRPYLVSSTGEVLADRLHTNGPLSPLTGQECGVSIADALAVAHEVGLTHGAVQPATVLMVHDRTVLAGFETMAPGLTVPVTVGSYTPPEQVAAVSIGRIVTSQAGDVYSLGVMVYVALGGKLPWKNAPMDLALRAEPLPELPGSTPELLDLLRAAVSIDHAARPTAVQFRDWLAGLDLSDAVGTTEPISPDLLSGQGTRKVGRRTMALIVGAGGTVGVTGGVLGSGVSFGASTGTVAAAGSTPALAGSTALPGSAALPGSTMPAGLSGAGGTGVIGGGGTIAAGAGTAGVTTAAVTTAAATGVTITKVAVITVIVTVIGVGGGYAGNQIYENATCNSVVGDKPATQVLTDAANLLNQTSYEFTLKISDQINADGAIDSLNRKARFTMAPPGAYTGEGRLIGSDLYVTGPVANTSPGEWVRVDPTTAGPGDLLTSSLNLSSTASTILSSTTSINRDGCDFDGVLNLNSSGTSQPDSSGTGTPFRASIEGDEGRLTYLKFTLPPGILPGDTSTSQDVEAKFSNFGTTVDVAAPDGTAPTTDTTEPTTVPPDLPVRTSLTGAWSNGTYLVLVNDGVVGVARERNDRLPLPLCSEYSDTSGTSIKVVCPGETDSDFVINIELFDNDRIIVRSDSKSNNAYPGLDGTYRFVAS